jgi:CHAD domain-containing protein
MHQAKALISLPDAPAEAPLGLEEVSVTKLASAENHDRDRTKAETPAPEWMRVRKLAMQQLDRFISLEPKVLQGDDPGAVHDMRVASRRLQQVLSLLYPAPVPRELRKLRRKIRRARRALSEVRNCDVQIKRVERSLAGRRTSHRATWEAVQQYLVERREAMFEEGLGKLSKLNVATLYVRLKNHLSTNGTTPPPDRTALEDVFAHPQVLTPEEFYARLGESLAELGEAYETRVAESQQNSSQPALHRVRIAAKRLRYLIEVMHELEFPGSAEALAWLRKLQRHLGEWHDLEVQEQMLIEMVARPKFLREQLDLAIGVEKVIQRHRSVKKRYVEKYFQMTAGSGENHHLREWVTSFRAERTT